MRFVDKNADFAVSSPSGKRDEQSSNNFPSFFFKSSKYFFSASSSLETDGARPSLSELNETISGRLFAPIIISSLANTSPKYFSVFLTPHETSVVFISPKEIFSPAALSFSHSVAAFSSSLNSSSVGDFPHFSINASGSFSERANSVSFFIAFLSSVSLLPTLKIRTRYKKSSSPCS